MALSHFNVFTYRGLKKFILTGVNSLVNVLNGLKDSLI